MGYAAGQLPSGKQGLAIHGAMLYLHRDRWKEFKAGCVFDVENEMRRDKQTGDYAEFGHAVNLSYVGSLAFTAEFGWEIWTEAQRRGWQQAAEHQVLGDGAKWIWKLRDEHFPYSDTLVDWYHATEHLGQAKQLCYPEPTPQASRWYNALELALFQGHADQVVQALTTATPTLQTAETLRKARKYFQNNQRRMQYQDLRD